MRKVLIALLVVCLLGVGAAGVLSGSFDRSALLTSAHAAAPAEESAPAAGAAETADTAEMPAEAADTAEAAEPAEEAFSVRVPDYDAMYALHDPAEVIGTVDGRELTWGEYFYLYFSQAKQMENYFTTMAQYYGAAPDWADQVEEESDATFADLIADSAEETVRQIYAIEILAEENGVELTEEQLAAIREQEEQDILGSVGEGKTEEDFNAYIETIYLPRSLYDRMNRINFLYRQGFVQTYGENGELVEDDVALQYLTDNEYMAATHILLMTIDPATFAELDEAAAAEKLQQAQAFADELRAIEDPEERLARFAELKAEFCEDTGKEAYPDGYVFVPGTMVPEFESAILGLEDYQVSDPVKTDYGYHVIMRLPLDPDAVIEYSNDGTPLSARSKAANEAYNQQLQDKFDSLEVEFAEGFEAPNLLDYLG